MRVLVCFATCAVLCVDWCTDLKPLHEKVHVDFDIVCVAVALGCLLPIVNPAEGGKVGRLSTIETLVKASMVAVGEGHNELTGLLGYLRK